MGAAMEIRTLADADAAGREAARIIAAESRAAVAARGGFTMALSGGNTPVIMLRHLALQDVPWQCVQVVQVDERIAPAGSPDRNFSQLRKHLLEHTALPPGHLHPMPVDSPDLRAAAAQYAATLRKLAGTPPVLDLVHLGLGVDGHTASLVIGDPVLDISDADVALTEIYQGWQRMTLTYPLINRARLILWLVVGTEKAQMLTRLRTGDETIPAGRVRRERTLVLTDQAAASHPEQQVT